MLLSAVAAEPLVSLAVLPFGNLSEYRGRLLDRRAAAAVSAEAPAAWGPVDLATVLQAIEDLNAPAPLETADVQRVCARLQAAVAVTGVVREVRIHAQGAEVTIMMDVIEPLSGEVIGRAPGVGKFSSREALPVEARVEQALALAARSAWTALGPPPTVVGWAAATPIEGHVALRLADKVRLTLKAVVLLLPPEGSPAAPPLAAAVVESLTPGIAQAKLIGEREPVPAGAVALAIGRVL